MIPITKEEEICIINCPAICLLCIIKGSFSIQKASMLITFPISQNKRYVQKSLFEGPKIIIPNTILLEKKAINEKKTIANKERIICHLNSSK